MIQTLLPHQSAYDVCIIGAGPAGLTIASELAYSGLRICVLESGETHASPFAADLREVEADGLQIKSDSRERIVGGASVTWDGRSAPLDEVDFEPRGWPGWPISRREMFQYMAEAVRYRFPSEHDFAIDQRSSMAAGWGPWEGLVVKPFVAVRPPYRFDALKSAFQREGLDLWTDATVTCLRSERADDGRRTVTAAVCHSSAGVVAEVTAKHFVLATGGIENARILLNSPTAAGTLGNEHDRVGRYFMNHPKGSAGLLHLRRALPRTSPYVDQAFGSKVKYAGLRLAPEVQRASGLLNSYVGFQQHVSRGSGVRDRLDGLRERAFSSSRLRWLSRTVGNGWRRVSPPVRTLRLRWFLEMEPRSTNRVTLAGRTDALGTRLPHVHYELSERDRATIVTLHGMLQQNVARLNLGSMESSVEEVLAAAVRDASHHLGSTRMGADPNTSVVDGNCRVHTVTNLHVAGGSVFSTGGSANPTLTIVALAIRLARHLLAVCAPHQTIPLRPAVQRAATGVVVVGAGRRVAGDVVPSLESHGDRFEVTGIYARTTATILGPHRRHDVQPIETLDQEAIGRARFIYLGVPRDSVISVLKTVRRWSNLELVLDTPVPTSRRALSMLRQFRRTHVAEDSAYLPWLDAVRGFWAANGLKGPLQIECDRSAFRYHAVALVKVLCGTPDTPASVVGAKRREGTFSIQLTNGSATIREPRDYSVGILRVTRDGVTVSSHRGDGVVPIEMLSESGLCVGFDVGGAQALLSPAESQLVGRIGSTDSIVSQMLALKRVGLSRMFAMMADGREPWPLERGLDDARVDQVGGA